MASAGFSRRAFVTQGLGSVVVGGMTVRPAPAFTQTARTAESSAGLAAVPGFPRQPAKLVEETVGAAHAKLDRVRELVTAYPELAKCSWDWGFGDWESPLEAASHTGQREVARFLIEHGARPSVFTFAMLGELEIVKGMLTAHPDLLKHAGPHGLSLLHHARVGGEPAAAVLAHLQSIGAPDTAASAVEKARADELAGTYASSDGAVQIQVTAGKGGISLRANDGIPRGLYPLADGSFHPAGAPSVRVRFDAAEAPPKSVVLVVGGRTVKAERST